MGGLAAAFALTAAPAAVAQTTQERDPAGSTPPGTVYELPVETGRADAAPRGAGKRKPGDSAIRGEDGGYGTSPRVPGATAAPEPRDPAAPSTQEQGRDEGAPPSPGEQADEPADATTPPSEPAPTPVASATAENSVSPTGTIVLLALAALAALGLGIAGRRRT